MLNSPTLVAILVPWLSHNSALWFLAIFCIFLNLKPEFWENESTIIATNAGSFNTYIHTLLVYKYLFRSQEFILMVTIPWHLWISPHLMFFYKLKFSTADNFQWSLKTSTFWSYKLQIIFCIPPIFFSKSIKNWDFRIIILKNDPITTGSLTSPSTYTQTHTHTTRSK